MLLHNKVFFLFLYIINISEQLNPFAFQKTEFSNQIIKSNIKIVMQEPKITILDNLLDYEIKNNKQVGRIIVEQISSLLPKVDSIGHNILHANNEFINYILDHNLFNDQTKKIIILSSIQLAQMGDNMGSEILQLYYLIVEKCL